MKLSLLLFGFALQAQSPTYSPEAIALARHAYTCGRMEVSMAAESQRGGGHYAASGEWGRAWVSSGCDALVRLWQGQEAR